MKLRNPSFDFNAVQIAVKYTLSADEVRFLKERFQAKALLFSSTFMTDVIFIYEPFVYCCCFGWMAVTPSKET